MTKRKTPIDWPAIERDYRAGAMANADLVAWYSVNESTLRMRAKRYGWVRGAVEVVRGCDATPITPETTRPEAIVARGRNLTLRLLDELEATTSRLGELQTLIDTALDTGDKQREAIEQAFSLKTRADVLKSLALTAKTFAETAAPAGKKAERQAAADEAAAGGGKFAPRRGPRLAISNP